MMEDSISEPRGFPPPAIFVGKIDLEINDARAPIRRAQAAVFFYPPGFIRTVPFA